MKTDSTKPQMSTELEDSDYATFFADLILITYSDVNKKNIQYLLLVVNAI